MERYDDGPGAFKGFDLEDPPEEQSTHRRLIPLDSITAKVMIVPNHSSSSPDLNESKAVGIPMWRAR